MELGMAKPCRASSHRPRARARLTPRPQAAGQQRTCVVCGAQAACTALMALEAEGTRRRGWACIRRSCLAEVGGGRIGAALRQAARVADDSPTEPQLHALATARIEQLLGLARRAGQLAWAAAEVEALADGASQAVLVVDDAPPRRRRRLAEVGTWPAQALARATGLANVVAVAIRPGRLHERAAYWLRLWYETAPDRLHDVPGPGQVCADAKRVEVG